MWMLVSVGEMILCLSQIKVLGQLFPWFLSHITRTAVWPRQSLYFALYSPLTLSIVWARRGETNCMHKAKSVFYWEKNTNNTSGTSVNFD